MLSTDVVKLAAVDCCHEAIPSVSFLLKVEINKTLSQWKTLLTVNIVDVTFILAILSDFRTDKAGIFTLFERENWLPRLSSHSRLDKYTYI